MKNSQSYTRNYFMPPVTSMKWAQKEYIDKPPIWCSVDLRDGNQALVVPMSLEEKLAFFKVLVDVGFKEIEVGFPAASETEYAFTRALIEKNMIPDDVTIQVLTQAREHIIDRTYQALEGAKKAIVHVYNSTSVAQREQVFQKSKEEIMQIAVSGAEMVKNYADQTNGNFQFEYSPESFTGSEMDYALEVCNRVLDVWQPSPDNKVIVNLPSTVSLSMPHVLASQIEYMSDHMKYRDNVIISLHPHNDRGSAVADAELGMLAGGQRVEGTLFGNGERTGNVDIITLALNMYAHGVDPGLHFENIPEITRQYEYLTGMHVPERHPYAGQLVFAAFSGSHQDAIAKGMKWRETHDCKFWSVPYLPIDPKDIGREYDGDVIRINSQSGKGGIGFLLERNYGFSLPPKMREELGYAVKSVSDHRQKELKPEDVYEIFNQKYVNIDQPLRLESYQFEHNDAKDAFCANVDMFYKGQRVQCKGKGNGQLDAISHALQDATGIMYSHLVYSEHAMEIGSKSKAVAYISIDSKDGKSFWGVGIHTDIMTSSSRALVSAINNMEIGE